MKKIIKIISIILIYELFMVNLALSNTDRIITIQRISANINLAPRVYIHNSQFQVLLEQYLMNDRFAKSSRVDLLALKEKDMQVLEDLLHRAADIRDFWPVAKVASGLANSRGEKLIFTSTNNIGTHGHAEANLILKVISDQIENSLSVSKKEAKELLAQLEYLSNIVKIDTSDEAMELLDKLLELTSNPFKGKVVYTTLRPCGNCLRLFEKIGLKEVIYAVEHPDEEFVARSEEVARQLRQKGIRIGYAGGEKSFSLEPNELFFELYRINSFQVLSDLIDDCFRKYIRRAGGDRQKKDEIKKAQREFTKILNTVLQDINPNSNFGKLKQHVYDKTNLLVDRHDLKLDLSYTALMPAGTRFIHKRKINIGQFRKILLQVMQKANDNLKKQGENILIDDIEIFGSALYLGQDGWVGLELISDVDVNLDLSKEVIQHSTRGQLIRKREIVIGEFRKALLNFTGTEIEHVEEMEDFKELLVSCRNHSFKVQLLSHDIGHGMETSYLLKVLFDLVNTDERGYENDPDYFQKKSIIFLRLAGIEDWKKYCEKIIAGSFDLSDFNTIKTILTNIQNTIVEKGNSIITAENAIKTFYFPGEAVCVTGSQDSEIKKEMFTFVSIEQAI